MVPSFHLRTAASFLLLTLMLSGSALAQDDDAWTRIEDLLESLEELGSYRCVGTFYLDGISQGTLTFDYDDPNAWLLVYRNNGADGRMVLNSFRCRLSGTEARLIWMREDGSSRTEQEWSGQLLEQLDHALLTQLSEEGVADEVIYASPLLFLRWALATHWPEALPGGSLRLNPASDDPEELNTEIILQPEQAIKEDNKTVRLIRIDVRSSRNDYLLMMEYRITDE